MNLYLAEVSLTTYRYPEGSSTQVVHRLVKAETPEEARTKVESALQRDNPYGNSANVDWVEITQTIE